MHKFFPLLSLISIVVFALLGWRLAVARRRNITGWSLGAAVLPPVLIVLWRLKPLAAPEESDPET